MGPIARLLPYVLRYRDRYASGLLIVLAGSLLSVAGPLLIKAAIDAIGAGNGSGGVLRLAAALAALGAARSALLFKGRFSIVATSRMIEFDLRGELLRKLLRLPARYFDLNPAGELESRVLNDVEGARMVVGVGTMMIVSSGLLALFSVVSMLLIDARLAAIAMTPLLLVSAVTAVLTRRIYRQSEEVQERLGSLSVLAQENFTGARVIRAFAREDSENRRFAEASASYRDANLELARTRGCAWGLMAFLIEGTVGLTLLVGGEGIIAGTLTRGEFVAFAAYEIMLAWPVIAMGWVITIWQRGAACMSRLGAILDEAEEGPAAGAHAPPPAAGRIEIRNLRFRYAEDRPPALDGVSLEAAPGERVAIVGRTGSGKSTLISILLGLYRVPDGSVLLDGKDLNAYPRENLRDAIGSVAQDAFLFSERIAANIAFGLRDGRPRTGGDEWAGAAAGGADREAVLLAAEQARMSPDLARFPGGIDQIIGERGITLSGGQKQRTALARALIRQPKILLLDDALSSVDVDTEREILLRLDAFLAGRTCLLVTHRFSVLPRMDRIVVLDAGRVVEQGTHAELTRRGGLYAALAARQKLEESLKEA